MGVAIVTDEICAVPEEAVALGLEWGIQRYELRSLEGNRVPDIDAGMVERLLRLRAERGIVYTSLSPGNYKLPLCHADMAAHRGERLQRAIALAHQLDVDKMVIFGIQRDVTDGVETFGQVCDILGETARTLQAEGIQALVENEPGWWADTVDNTVKLLQAIGAPLMLNWDPGNLWSAGERVPLCGYEALKPWIGHVHIKDYRDGVGVPLGEGDMDWPKMVQALQRDNYAGEWMIETHCEPKAWASERSARALRGMMGTD